MHFFCFGAHSHAPAPCLTEHSSAQSFSVPAYGWHSSPQCSSSASQLAGTPVPSAGPAGRPGGLSSSAGGTVCMVDCKFLRTRCNSDVTLVTCEWVRVNVYLKDSSMHCQRMDRNGPCMSRAWPGLGNFVDKEGVAIWWWRGWIPPFRRSRGRRWRERIGAEVTSVEVALSRRSCAPRLRGASGCRAGSRCVVCGVDIRD